jgi:hypothetical protein
MPGLNRPDRKNRADWNSLTRIAAGFVVGTLLVWWWAEQGEVATAILAISVGAAIGAIAFDLSRRQ